MIEPRSLREGPRPEHAAQPGRRQGHERPDRPGTGDAPLRDHATSSATASTPRGWSASSCTYLAQPGQVGAARRLGQRVLRQRARAIWSRCSNTSGPTSSSPTGPRPRGLAKLPTEHQGPARGTLDPGQAAGRTSRRGRDAGGRGRGQRSAGIAGIIFKSVGLPDALRPRQLPHVAPGRRAWRTRCGSTSPAAERDFDLELTQPLRLRRDRQGHPGGPPRLRGQAGEVKLLLEKQFPEKDRRLDRRHDRQDQAGRRRRRASCPAR